MNRVSHYSLILLLVAIALPASGGTFLIDTVWYKTQLSSDGTWVRVMVGASARYDGAIDENDHSWGIQTNLTHMGYITEGVPVSGTEIPWDLEISVKAEQHGAFKDIMTCNVHNNNHVYEGRATVGIYRQYSPEIDTGTAGWAQTNCNSTPDGSGGTADPDDDPEDPIQTGTGGMCDGQDPCTPVLVDLDGGAFQLTSWQQGVRFDINRDGELELLSWTAGESGDAWLALDRNGNGLIDDGGELFGNFTDQPPTDQPHGYHALAVFDHDGDGRITPSDPIFSELLLWSDRNHDGISQAGELLSLSRAEIEWIGLDFVESRARDPHGNELRYRARIGRSIGTTHSVDVFLQSSP